METQSSSGRVRFGDFEVNLRSGELRKHGIKIKLHDQPFQILTSLIEQPGEVVTREQLRQKLWPADTFVDFDVGLNSAVKKLRDALGDAAESPRFIETLPRRGYRFIALVDVPVTGSAEPTAAGAEGLPAKANVTDIVARPLSSAWPRVALVAIVTVTAALAIAGAFNFYGTREAPLEKRRVKPIQSIAVLPLENLTGDPAQSYFTDGMTDALITDLGQVSSLSLISRTSSMRYAGTKKPLREIARELNADAVVEGTVTRSGSRVRVDVQLIEAATDHQLWAKPYERELSDILALQDDMARAIATEIRVNLTSDEETRLSSARRVNPDAYEDYVKGRYFLDLSRWPLGGGRKRSNTFN